jgi:hypothetical protein
MSATGRLVLHIFAALRKFEVERFRERTRSAPAASRARGRVGRGRAGLARGGQDHDGAAVPRNQPWRPCHYRSLERRDRGRSGQHYAAQTGLNATAFSSLAAR